MQEKSTDELDAQLRNTTPDCMDKYYKENRYYNADRAENQNLVSALSNYQ